MALSPLKGRDKYLSGCTINGVSRATDAAHFVVGSDSTTVFGEAPGPEETQPRASAGQGAARALIDVTKKEPLSTTVSQVGPQFRSLRSAPAIESRTEPSSRPSDGQVLRM